MHTCPASGRARCAAATRRLRSARRSRRRATTTCTSRAARAAPSLSTCTSSSSTSTRTVRRQGRAGAHWLWLWPLLLLSLVRRSRQLGVAARRQGACASLLVAAVPRLLLLFGAHQRAPVTCVPRASTADLSRCLSPAFSLSIDFHSFFCGRARARADKPVYLGVGQASLPTWYYIFFALFCAEVRVARHATERHGTLVTTKHSLFRSAFPFPLFLLLLFRFRCFSPRYSCPHLAISPCLYSRNPRPRFRTHACECMRMHAPSSWCCGRRCW